MFVPPPFGFLIFFLSISRSIENERK